MTYTDADFERDCKGIKAYSFAVDTTEIRVLFSDALERIIADRNRLKAMLEERPHKGKAQRIIEELEAEIKHRDEANSNLAVEVGRLEAEVERLANKHDDLYVRLAAAEKVAVIARACRDGADEYDALTEAIADWEAVKG